MCNNKHVFLEKGNRVLLPSRYKGDRPSTLEKQGGTCVQRESCLEGQGPEFSLEKQPPPSLPVMAVSLPSLNPAATTESRALAQIRLRLVISILTTTWKSGCHPHCTCEETKLEVTQVGGESGRCIATLWAVLLPTVDSLPTKATPTKNWLPRGDCKSLHPSFLQHTHTAPLELYNFGALFSVLEPKTSTEKAEATTTPMKGSAAPPVN